MAETAKIFWNGRSQAVRLPKAFRFVEEEVQIYRRPDGAVVLAPLSADRPVLPPAQAAVIAIESLRSAITEGLDSGEASPWQVEDIKKLARER